MYAKYREFCTLRDAGMKQKAALVAQEFVAEYIDNPNPDFVAEICATVDHKLNFHIWSGVVAPFFLADPANPIAIKCLIQTIQNLYSHKPTHEQLGWVTDWQLLDRYLDLIPGDRWATERKKVVLSEWLAYTVHEWPSGVLYGNDGATVDECQDILANIEELKELDGNSEYGELCLDVKEKTLAYLDKLLSAADSKP